MEDIIFNIIDKSVTTGLLVFIVYKVFNSMAERLNQISDALTKLLERIDEK